VTAPLRVLMVEDSPSDAELIAVSLTDAAPGAVALTHVRRLDQAFASLASDQFDVMLLDLDLPDSGAKDTVARARGHWQDIPIVVHTGDTDDRRGIKAVREGAQDYVRKGDFDGHVLLHAIRHAMRRHSPHAATDRPGRRDALTGLADGALFRERLAGELDYATRHRHRLAVLAIGFAPAAASERDALALIVARRLAASVRESDAVARLGPGEFAVLQTHVGEVSHALLLARKLIEVLDKPLHIGPREAVLKPAIGVAVYPESGRDAPALLQGADAAKRAGMARGGRLAVLYGPDLA
jgi:PleD family two-component response regulator